MSKPIKELIRKELISRFEGLTSLAVVGFTGIDGVATHQIRRRLRAKQIHMNVVKNSIARQAFDAVKIPGGKELLAGPCAIAFVDDATQMGVVEIIRELIDMSKETPALTVKAALLDGEVFGPDKIGELSNYPTREEAIATVVRCALSPGSKLAGCLTAPGATIASLLKTIQEDKEAEGDSGKDQAT